MKCGNIKAPIRNFNITRFIKFVMKFLFTSAFLKRLKIKKLNQILSKHAHRPTL